jgi:hypothetical protein
LPRFVKPQADGNDRLIRSRIDRPVRLPSQPKRISSSPSRFWLEATKRFWPEAIKLKWVTSCRASCHFESA